MTNSEASKPRAIKLTVSTSDGQPVHLTNLEVVTAYGPISIPIRSLLSDGDTFTFGDDVELVFR
jgi:hypothetical protein